MNFDEMMECIEILHRERNIKELKAFLNEINPADLAQLLEEVTDERTRVFLFRMLTKENAAETFVEFDGDTQENLIRALARSLPLNRKRPATIPDPRSGPSRKYLIF